MIVDSLATVRLLSRPKSFWHSFDGVFVSTNVHARNSGYFSNPPPQFLIAGCNNKTLPLLCHIRQTIIGVSLLFAIARNPLEPWILCQPECNLIFPFEFSVHTQLVDGSTGNSTDIDIVDTIVHLVGNLTTNQNEGNVSSTESDVDDSITPSVVVVEKDSTQSDFDGQSTVIADTSDQPTVGEAQVTLGDVIQSLSNVAADRDSIISDTSENTCQVCASRDECKHPRKAHRSLRRSF